MTSGPVAFGKTDWTIAQTFAWICLRDPWQLDRAHGTQTAPILDTARSPVVPLPEAERQIRDLLAQSRLHCTGVRNGDREPIPPSPWVSRSFLFQSNAVRDFECSDRWDSVLFARTDVLGLWPPNGETVIPSVALRAEKSNVSLLKPGVKSNVSSSKSEWFDYAYKRLAQGDIKPKRGTAVTLAREILAQLPSNTYQLNTIEKVTRLAVKDWKGKNPQTSGK